MPSQPNSSVAEFEPGDTWNLFRSVLDTMALIVKQITAAHLLPPDSPFVKY